MATAHYNLQSYTMGLEFATTLEKVMAAIIGELQRLKHLIEKAGNVPELLAEMEEVQKLIKDLQEGLAANPEAEKMQQIPDDEKMQEE